jgi:hypothetical protein
MSPGLNAQEEEMAADRHERIRQRAYELWEQEGRPEGRAEEYWRRAEAEVPAEGGTADMNPGDEAPPGTPGTGEDICPDCGGNGRKDNKKCPTCGGTGRVVKGISGG